MNVGYLVLGMVSLFWELLIHKKFSVALLTGFFVKFDSVGVLVRGTKREDVERGQVLAKSGPLVPVL
jgi:hypothetical protein